MVVSARADRFISEISAADRLQSATSFVLVCVGSVVNTATLAKKHKSKKKHN